MKKIPVIVTELGQQIKGKDQQEVFVMVNTHFNSFWSIESDEWKLKMSQEEKEKFVKSFIQYVNK